MVVEIGLTVGLALAGFGPWSLAWGHLASNLTVGIMLYIWSPVPGRPRFDPTTARLLVREGLPLAGAALVRRRGPQRRLSPRRQHPGRRATRSVPPGLQHGQLAHRAGVRACQPRVGGGIREVAARPAETERRLQPSARRRDRCDPALLCPARRAEPARRALRLRPPVGRCIRPPSLPRRGDCLPRRHAPGHRCVGRERPGTCRPRVERPVARGAGPCGRDRCPPRRSAGRRDRTARGGGVPGHPRVCAGAVATEASTCERWRDPSGDPSPVLSLSSSSPSA